MTNRRRRHSNAFGAAATWETSETGPPAINIISVHMAWRLGGSLAQEIADYGMKLGESKA